MCSRTTRPRTSGHGFIQYAPSLAIVYSPMMQAYLVVWGRSYSPVWDRSVLRIFGDKIDAIAYCEDLINT
jgi:hypothetical protein